MAKKPESRPNVKKSRRSRSSKKNPAAARSEALASRSAAFHQALAISKGIQHARRRAQHLRELLEPLRIAARRLEMSIVFEEEQATLAVPDLTEALAALRRRDAEAAHLGAKRLAECSGAAEAEIWPQPYAYGEEMRELLASMKGGAR